MILASLLSERGLVDVDGIRTRALAVSGGALFL
jgi:hypothetical protein